MTQKTHTPGPWFYRPQRFDDWGYVRAATTEDGWSPFICQSKAPTTEEQENECRRNGTDPWEANARLIAAAPELLADHDENARILGYLCNELQGIVDAGKLAALHGCLDRSIASAAKARGQS